MSTVDVNTETQARPQPPATPPTLRPVELSRWAWRQLTSMRVALILLFLLAVVAVPGSVFPQRRVNPLAVADYLRSHPTAGPWMDRFSLFDVYSSPWFSAVYVLLFISLVGCIVPRTRQHVRAMRAKPPPAPRNLDRLPEHRTVSAAGDATAVLDAAERELRRRHYRVVRAPDSIAGERGHLRETGNLVFHCSLLLILLGAAIGGLIGYRGTVLVVVGDGFSNTLTQYDGFSPGRFYGADDLPPFSVHLDEFDATFVDTGPMRGAAKDFIADVTYRDAPGEPEKTATIRVNHPLKLDGADIHLLGHGYAPRFTVRDGEGNVVFEGPVPFLPQDANFTSAGVIKVPEAAPEQLGFNAFFLPTTVMSADGRPTSIFPDARNASVVLQPWAGDLGIDSGEAQSVYRLDTDDMHRVETTDGKPVSELLGAGQTLTLPDGLGSITYDGYVRWVNMQVSRNPGLPVLLAGAGLAIISVLLSLNVRRRRVWVRAGAPVDGLDGAGTLVEVAGLDRAHGGDLDDEIDGITAALGRQSVGAARRDS